MAAETATIRVGRETRDLLAADARRRGLSLAASLAEIASERQAEAGWRSERDASRLDSTGNGVADEERLWDAVSSDGLD